MYFFPKYIVRKRALGDVLWIEPVISALAKSGRRLIVHTKYNELFLNYPFKNVVFKDHLSFFEKVLVRLGHLPLLKKIFIDLELTYEQSPHQHLLFAYQKRASVPILEEYPAIYLSEKEKEQFLPLAKSGGYAVLHAENKQLKNYRKTFGINWEVQVAHLLKKGLKVYQIGADDMQIPGAEYKRTTVRELIALLNHANLFLGVDSGPSHISAALKVPSVLFFGAVNSDYRHFKSLFKGEILQQPCVYAGCFHQFKKPDDVVCRIVGDIGVPPCSSFSDEQCILAVDNVLKKEGSVNLIHY